MRSGSQHPEAPGASVIDLRSDTRTWPDAAMREAMARAAVGDESYGDDPTVAELEARAAELTGLAAAVFTCSGTMSNLLAILSLIGFDHDGLVVTGEDSHVVHYENDGARILGGARVVTVSDDPYGELDAAAITTALVAEAAAPAARRVVCLENTSNRRGGNAADLPAMYRQISAARGAGALVHLDGARLPNASVALGVPMADLAHGVDTVAFSVCKGLGAPAGSLLCGDGATIERARYLRKMVGGITHQTGIVAAAGLLALSHLPLLADDHRRAALLADGLRTIPGLAVRTVPVPTNIVVASVHGVPASALIRRLAADGVLGLPLSEHDVRFVVHREHEDLAIAQAVARCADAVAALRRDARSGLTPARS